MMVGFGTLPDSGDKEITFGNSVDMPISCWGYATGPEGRDQVLNGILPQSTVDTGSTDVYLTAYHVETHLLPRIMVRTRVTASQYSAEVFVKYIKTSD